MRFWSEISGFAASKNKHILIRVGYLKGSVEEHLYYYQCSETHFQTLDLTEKLAFRDNTNIFYFARFKAKDRRGPYTSINKRLWGWAQTRRTKETKIYSYYLIDPHLLEGLTGAQKPEHFPFDEEAYLADPHSFTGTREPTQPGITPKDISTFFQRRHSLPLNPHPTPSTEPTEQDEDTTQAPLATQQPPTDTQEQDTHHNHPPTNATATTPNNMASGNQQDELIKTITDALKKLDPNRLHQVAQTIANGNIQPGHEDRPNHNGLNNNHTSILINNEKAREYGKLLTDRAALENSLLINMDKISSGYPPVLPRGCVIQTPSPELLTQELANKMNESMMECANKLSNLLIAAQQAHIDKLTSKITAMEEDNGLSEEARYAGLQMMRRNQALFPQPKNRPTREEPIKFFIPPREGTAQRLMVPAYDPSRIHATGPRAPGQQPRTYYGDRKRGRTPPARRNPRRRSNSRSRYSGREESESDDRDYEIRQHPYRRVNFSADEDHYNRNQDYRYPHYNTQAPPKN